MTIAEQKKRFPVGTRVVHKSNPTIRGKVVSAACFGPCAGSYNVMLQLTCGLQYEVTPYVLKKVGW